MTIDPKYQTKALSVLTDPEKIREVTIPKITTTVDLFQDDWALAQQLDLNISRILRMKFHEWIHTKLQ